MIYSLVSIREGAYPHPAGQVWAEPDFHEAAVILRRVAAGCSLRPHPPSAITDRYQRQFSAPTLVSAYRQRLEKIRSRRFAIDKELEQRLADLTDRHNSEKTCESMGSADEEGPEHVGGWGYETKSSTRCNPRPGSMLKLLGLLRQTRPLP